MKQSQDTTSSGLDPEALSRRGTPRECCVAVIAGKPLGMVYKIPPSGLIIGRSLQCDISCDDPLVSRRHAHVVRQGTEVKIVDLNSTNGLYVNFERVSECRLTDGDKIGVGETILKFLDQDTIETRFHNELYQLAILDGLTQVINRKHFDDLLSREFAKAHRFNEPLCLCMCDIDFFKKLNDAHGHAAGDYVLRKVAETLQSLLRREDILARYGGEEFCVLLPNQTLSEGAKVAEKLCAAVAGFPFEYNNRKLQVTLSIGVGAISESIDSVEAFLRLADAHLYKAKLRGRNSVFARDDPEEEDPFSAIPGRKS